MRNPFTAVMVFVAGIVLTAFPPPSWSEDPAPQPTPNTAKPPDPPPQPVAEDLPPSLLKAAQERMVEINHRAEQLDQREQRLKMLEEEFKRIAQENTKLRTEIDQMKKSTGAPSGDPPLVTLSKMYAQMAPEEAAPRMEKMDQALALKILVQLKPKQAAQILSGMNPDTAATFSEQLVKTSK